MCRPSYVYCFFTVTFGVAPMYGMAIRSRSFSLAAFFQLARSDNSDFLKECDGIFPSFIEEAQGPYWPIILKFSSLIGMVAADVFFVNRVETELEFSPEYENAFEPAAVSPSRLVHFKKSLRLVFISFNVDLIKLSYPED